MEAGRRASSGETHNRPTKSVGSEKSIEKSPLHHQARNGRGISAPSPAWEGKGEGSHGTTGRPRTRPSASGDESPDTSAAVPKFGDWDENNPASADGYTHIFNRVREERQSAMVPGMQAESSHDYYRRQSANNDSAKSCCFPWGRK